MILRVALWQSQEFQHAACTTVNSLFIPDHSMSTLMLVVMNNCGIQNTGWAHAVVTVIWRDIASQQACKSRLSASAIDEYIRFARGFVEFVNNDKLAA